MTILEFFRAIFGWLRDLWNELPPETKAEIVKAIVDGMKGVWGYVWESLVDKTADPNMDIEGKSTIEEILVPEDGRGDGSVGGTRGDNLVIPLESESIIRHGAFVDLNWGEEEKRRFTETAIAAVNSREFRRELSDRIGAIRPGETKEEFVERATAITQALLEEKLTRGSGPTAS